MWVALAALAVSSVLNALYYLPAIIQIWSKAQPGENLPQLPVKRPSLAFVVAVLVLGAGTVLLGVCCSGTGALLSLGLSLL